MKNLALITLFAMALTFSSGEVTAQTVDIKCHGSDTDVILLPWETAVVSLDVAAGPYAGGNDVDIWVLLEDMTNEEIYSYSGAPLQPGLTGWQLVGPSQPYLHSGPMLGTAFYWIYDWTLPVGDYIFLVFFDPLGDGVFGEFAAVDHVPVHVIPWMPLGMSYIPGGTFKMGDHHSNIGGHGYDELPLHDVKVKPFCMDIFETTNEAYCDLLNWAYGQNRIDISVQGDVHKKGDKNCKYCPVAPIFSKSDIQWDNTTKKFSSVPGRQEFPMIRVSWYGAAAYCNWKSERDNLTPCYNLTTWACDITKNGYRLPTEAEWEYAARGGQYSTYTMYHWGNSIDGSKANYYNSGDPYGTSIPHVTPTGYYNGSQVISGITTVSDMSNGYCLYDMSGNVSEWCNDWYKVDYYTDLSKMAVSPVPDPTGPSTGTWRVVRGGSWIDSTSFCRSAKRLKEHPGAVHDLRGFRTVKDEFPF